MLGAQLTQNKGFHYCENFSVPPKFRQNKQVTGKYIQAFPEYIVIH